jgi:hypothetical protein
MKMPNITDEIKKLLGSAKGPNSKMAWLICCHILTRQIHRLQNLSLNFSFMLFISRHGSSIAAITGSTRSDKCVFFEQVVSNKLQNTLALKPVASKKVSHLTGSSTLTDCRESTCHLTMDKTPDQKLQVASLLCDNETRTDASATANNSIIVQGMKEKNASFQSIKKNSEKDIQI